MTTAGKNIRTRNSISKSAPLTASIVGRILRKSLGDDPRKNEIMRHLLSAQDKYLRDMNKKAQP